MKEFVISEAQVETAILVGFITQTQDERKTKEYFCLLYTSRCV